MKKITVDYINKTYREYLLNKCFGKGKFGWYNVTLKNGRVVVGTTLQDLEESIKRELKKEKK